MNTSKAHTYIQNTIAGRPNGTEIIAGVMTTNCWEQHKTICNAECSTGDFDVAL